MDSTQCIESVEGKFCAFHDEVRISFSVSGLFPDMTFVRKAVKSDRAMRLGISLA